MLLMMLLLIVLLMTILLFTTPLSIPWERGFCYVVLLLTVGRWSLIAVKSGPSPLFIAKH
jgi:hypothetical protein